MSQSRSRSPMKIYQTDLTQPTLAEDLLKSPTYWPSETETCRVCLKSLFETLKNQSFYLRELERLINSKVSIAEFHAGLATKADFLELSSKLAELQTLIDKKTSVNDVELLISLKKNNSEPFQNLLEKIDVEVKQKVGFQEFNMSFERVNSKLAILSQNMKINEDFRFDFDGLEKKVEVLEDFIKDFHGKVQNNEKKKGSEVNKDLEMQDLMRRIGDVEKKVNQILMKVECDDFLKFSFGSNIDASFDKKKINDLLDSKVDIKVFQQESLNMKAFLQETLTELMKRLQSQALKLQVTQGLKDLEQFKQEALLKFEKVDEKLEMLWKSKPDKSEIRSSLHEINSKLHEKLITLSKSIQKDLKPEPEKENTFHPLSSKLDEIEKSLLLKVSVKDLCTLLDMKANVEEVNIALLEIHNELDCRNSVFPQGIWSFYNSSSGVVFKQLKLSADLQVTLQDEVSFNIGKSGFFALEVIVFSEDSGVLAVLKNGKRFLNWNNEKSCGNGKRVLEYVEVLQGDVIELVLPNSPDIRGNFLMWEIVI